MNVAAPLPVSPSPSNAASGRLVSTDGRTLPLVGARVAADARGGIARVVLTQTFRNPHDVPLTVTYSLPLPADAAVSDFAFTVGDRRIVGEIDRRAAARERFLDAVLTGRTAALVEEERSSLFSQEIGNIPPGARLVAELIIDQPLTWIGEGGGWEWRFPTAVAPRYLGGAGRVPDAERVTQDVAEGLAARVQLALTVRDTLVAGRAPESPSHRIAVRDREVSFAEDGGVALDRDIVVRWPVAGPAPGVSIDVARPSGDDTGYGLLTVVPPAPGRAFTPVARDLIVLLDTSGSMSGEPLDQARRVVGAVIATLAEGDQLEMVEFSSDARRWKPAPVRVTEGVRKEALAWLAGLRASGGTEMHAGILEALRPLRAESQRQIVLVTDGLIGFEAEVIGAVVRDLPAGARVHTVGVGSAVNRSLTGPVARAGRGVEVVIGLGEDPERAARRLAARTDAPLVVDLALAGTALRAHAPRRLPDLFAGAPVRLALSFAPEGGEIAVSGRTATGPFTATVTVPAVGAGSGSAAIGKLFAREQIEDLETELAAGADRAATEAAIEKLGLGFQVASRLTSWVAIASEPSVDPTQPTRRERIPQELPDGMSAEGLGLRQAPVRGMMAAAGGLRMAKMMAAPIMLGGPPAAPPAGAKGLVGRARQAVRGFFSDEGAPSESDAEASFQILEDEGPPALRLHGRITQQRAGLLAIEVTAPHPFDFDATVGAEVTLVLASGEEVSAHIAQATRPGPIRAGESLRLVFRFAGTIAPPASVVIESPALRTVIELA